MFQQPFTQNPPAFQHREHLSVHTGIGKSITNGFRAHCPDEPLEIDDWVVKFHSSVSTAESGVQWTQTLQPRQEGLPPLQVDVVVPYTKVFECAGPDQCFMTVPHPIQGHAPERLQVPSQICDKLAKGVYASVLNLIPYKNRRFYQGVENNDGWGLLQRLRSVTNDNGTHLDGLKSKRAKLSGTCNTLADFPIFKSELLQLVIDWQHAANQQLIIPSDTWSLGDTKQFVAEALSTVFEGKMEEWNNDPVNSGATVDTMIAKCVSLYLTGIRQNERKRKAVGSGSASFVASTSNEMQHQKQPRYDDHSEESEQWYSNYDYGYHPQQWQYQQGKGKGKGKGPVKGKGKGKGGKGKGKMSHRRELAQEKGKGKGKGSYQSWYGNGWHSNYPSQSWNYAHVVGDWQPWQSPPEAEVSASTYYQHTTDADDWTYSADQGSGGDWGEWGQ